MCITSFATIVRQMRCVSTKKSKNLSNPLFVHQMMLVLSDCCLRSVIVLNGAVVPSSVLWGGGGGVWQLASKGEPGQRFEGEEA